MKKTKIIATVGPVTQSAEQLTALYDAGVNIIRFNFSHADYVVAAGIVERVKQLNATGRTNLSLLLDTKGPEIRTGDLTAKIQYQKGDVFRIYTQLSVMGTTEKELFCDYPYIVEMAVGRSLSMDSGLFHVEILEQHPDYVLVRAKNDCLVGSRRHVNLPGEVIKMPGLTDQDKNDCAFAVEQGYDFIAMSFVRTRENIAELRSFLHERNADHIQIISKIESQEGVDNMDEIIDASDGIMVARGDLGVEVPIETLPVLQKQIVTKTSKAGKFVIIATHLLETMIENPFPTRAEVSDIYNSVMQKTDCTMLSGETTIGKYPIESVAMMTGVIQSAEANITYDHEDFSNDGLTPRDIEKKYLLRAALELGETLDVKCLLVFTKSGLLARLTSAFRPNRRVYAFTRNTSSVRAMNPLFGINPLLLPNWSEHLEGNVENAITFLKERNLLALGDKIIAVNDIQKEGKEIPVMEIITID